MHTTGRDDSVRLLGQSWLDARLRVKRAIDVLVALALLVLLSPTMLLIGAVVACTSPGGALFRQTRVGKGGRPFVMHKFRTMRLPGPDEPEGISPTDYGASRITAIGRFLRRTSLDELPQLFDVLRGAMSLVGPRPDLPHHAERYTDLQRIRLRMRPGITGLPQISGRNELGWPARYELDVDYVESWSLRLDATILAKTALTVLSGRGTELPPGPAKQ